MNVLEKLLHRTVESKRAEQTVKTADYRKWIFGDCRRLIDCIRNWNRNASNIVPYEAMEGHFMSWIRDNKWNEEEGKVRFGLALQNLERLGLASRRGTEIVANFGWYCDGCLNYMQGGCALVGMDIKYTGVPHLLAKRCSNFCPRQLRDLIVK